MKSPKQAICVLCMILGVAIIIIGIFVRGISIERHTVNIGSDIKFGADFYTEMYDVTRDVGFAINNAKNTIVDAVEGVCDAIGWLIVALGVIDISYFIYKFMSITEQADQENTPKTTYTSAYSQQAEVKLRQEAAEKAKREKEEEIIYKYIAEDKAKQQESKARKQAAEEKARKIALKISPTGTGYICPVCKTTNASFSPCVKCQYDPQIVININEGLSDEDYIDVTCPACKETLSFLPNEKNIVCPYCGKQIVLK